MPCGAQAQSRKPARRGSVLTVTTYSHKNLKQALISLLNTSAHRSIIKWALETNFYFGGWFAESWVINAVFTGQYRCCVFFA